jgi:hypothetical protein
MPQKAVIVITIAVWITLCLLCEAYEFLKEDNHIAYTKGSVEMAKRFPVRQTAEVLIKLEI